MPTFQHSYEVLSFFNQCFAPVDPLQCPYMSKCLIFSVSVFYDYSFTVLFQKGSIHVIYRGGPNLQVEYTVLDKVYFSSSPVVS